MKHMNKALVSASVLAIALSGTAQAQVVLPQAQPHGLGASSITSVLTVGLNCIGGFNPIGNNNGTTLPIAEEVVTTTPPLDCATQELQSQFDGQYISTGSGTGRAGWRTFADQLATGKNPFDLTNTDPLWNNYQFAFSDSPISLSDQTAFRTSSAANSLGNAIQIPLFVLPVAVAYDPIYGRNTSTGVDYKFNVKASLVTKDAGGNATGGLRMTKSDYCKIFNGEMLNWNNGDLKTRNGGQLLADPQDLIDNPTRWANDGAPIRLVGRGDGSGTTDIFTRHLAAACVGNVATTLKYEKNAQALPYTGSPNITPLIAGSPYNGAFTTTGFSNTTNAPAYQSISGAVFDKTALAFVGSAEVPGLYTLADGSLGVNVAIKFAPDKPSPSAPSVLLNGKVGYIGADFVKPSIGATLFSAALQSGASVTTFKGPTPVNAAAAFGTILPPQTIATSGAYNVTDTRQVKNPSTGQLETVDRANPFHWPAVLYANSATSLANPATGYAITGTTQILPYQCYKTAANRFAIANIIGLVLGKTTKQEIPFNVNVFTNTAPTAPGILAQNGIAALPAAWRAAITETFLKKSTQASGGFVLGQIGVSFNTAIEPVSGIAFNRYETSAQTGGNGLWIQSLVPTAQTAVNGTPAQLAKSNSNCTSGLGS